jgi:hypothetical protein
VPVDTPPFPGATRIAVLQVCTVMNPRLRGLTLTVTERCNLRCGYCYVPVEHGRTMSPEISDGAVDLLLRHAAPAPEAGARSASPPRPTARCSKASGSSSAARRASSWR